MSREITVDFCNQEGGCTRVKLTISSQGVRAEIVGSRDAQNVPYPQMSERPLRREWGRNGFESACDMASFVTGRSGGNYTVTGGPVCRRVILPCVDVGRVYQCQTYCVNNSRRCRIAERSGQ